MYLVQVLTCSRPLCASLNLFKAVPCKFQLVQNCPVQVLTGPRPLRACFNFFKTVPCRFQLVWDRSVQKSTKFSLVITHHQSNFTKTVFSIMGNLLANIFKRFSNSITHRTDSCNKIFDSIKNIWNSKSQFIYIYLRNLLSIWISDMYSQPELFCCFYLFALLVQKKKFPPSLHYINLARIFPFIFPKF